jgi:triosephosphate isomerase
LENAEISGALIGGASLKASDFNEISKIASKVQA